MKKYPNDLRILFKHNALPFHNRAMPAAIATMAAHAQGKFWEYHDKLFANQKALDDASLEKYAKEIGLNVAKFKKSLADPKIKANIQKDMDLAGKVNARGTPNSFINGRNLRGAVPYEQFEALVKEELAKAKTKCAGMSGDKCYGTKIIAKGKTFEPLDSKVNEFSAKGLPYLGAKNGDIVISEFSDFQ
jgi:protein-disulfide isomerase